MWYAVIRLLICVIIFIVVLILLKRRRLLRKRFIIIISIIVFIFVTILSYFTPVENLFFNFSTPQESFHYSTLGILQKVVEGKASAMVLYNNGSGDDISLQFIPKGSDGWKIGTSLSQIQIANMANKDYYITINKVKDINDFYIVIHESFADKQKEVSDNKNSSFNYIMDKNKGTDTFHYIYYAYVKDLDAYQLKIEGKEIPIKFN